jgi:hypothetical protein
MSGHERWALRIHTLIKHSLRLTPPICRSDGPKHTWQHHLVYARLVPEIEQCFGDGEVDKVDGSHHYEVDRKVVDRVIGKVA